MLQSEELVCLPIDLISIARNVVPFSVDLVSKAIDFVLPPRYRISQAIDLVVFSFDLVCCKYIVLIIFIVLDLFFSLL